MSVRVYVLLSLHNDSVDVRLFVFQSRIGSGFDPDTLTCMLKAGSSGQDLVRTEGTIHLHTAVLRPRIRQNSLYLYTDHIIFVKCSFFFF